jgi:hypothetical protein
MLAEAEAGMRQVELAKRRLAEGRYGVCQCCAEAINPARLAEAQRKHGYWVVRPDTVDAARALERPFAPIAETVHG